MWCACPLLMPGSRVVVILVARDTSGETSPMDVDADQTAVAVAVDTVSSVIVCV